MSMFSLLAWTNYSSEFIIKNKKMAFKFAEYCRMRNKF